jgi:tetratricopeptide (TPR) repeat protein
VSRSWEHRHTEHSANAISVLTALTVLDTAEVIAADLAVALDIDIAEIEAAVRELRQAGWVETRPGGGGDVLVDGARIWLSFDAPNKPKPDETAAIAGRFLAAATAALDLDRHERDEVAHWLTERKETVLTAIRAGVRTELHSRAATLAAAAWQVADQVPDAAWRRELARQGEDAAIGAREPLTLIDLLNRSATLFEEAGDRPAAEEQWVRVVQLAFEMGDHDRIVASLTTLIGLYDRWGRRGPAVDALLELADAQRDAGNVVGRADALAELGSIMLSAGRASTADTYFATADELLSQAPPDAVQPSRQARVLELWGRALWQLGHTIRARQCFRRALELLGDHDPVAAKRVRSLLDTHVDAPTLPDEKP